MIQLYEANVVSSYVEQQEFFVKNVFSQLVRHREQFPHEVKH